MNKLELLIIDPQTDFCDPKGSLYVKGAEEDMLRLANMIGRLGNKINRVRVTLDSHHRIDVAHPDFWVDSKGKHPDCFTIISSNDVKNGVWRPFLPNLTSRMIDYTTTLEKNGRFALCIWPPHCLIGSNGHNVFPILYNALTKWEEALSWNVDYVTKGSNVFTEHYGAIEAEVPDPQDNTTQVNTQLIETLMKADTILVAGEALSHCLKTTLEQIAFRFGDDSYLKKIVLLTDATSPVPAIPDVVDFPAIGKQFIEDMVKRGMRVSTTVDFLS